MTKQDLADGLKFLGIKKGDNIFVTSSLSRFGHVEGGAELIIDTLRECVGEGTIVMPSFNFNIFKDESPTLYPNTPSKMGAITEAFRKRKGVRRTNNLFHPLCYEGSINLGACDTYDTWGENSPYGLMSRLNFTAVLLGTEFYSCPIFHYAEQRNNVPYREPIEYNGYIDDMPVKCRRLRRKYGDSDHNKVFYSKYPFNEVKIGNSICRGFSIESMINFLDSKLKVNPNYLKLESEFLSPMPTMDTFNITEGIKKLFLSKGLKENLDYLRRFIPLRYHTWDAREKVWTWTIPEGGLTVGEYTVKGYTDECIILPIHLCHVLMANDNLSGVAAAIELIDKLERTPDLKYSYKFLFLSETIGTIAYLSRFGTNYKYGIVIDSVGTKGDIVVTRTKCDSILNLYITGRTNEFLSDEHLKSGNDERTLDSVGIPSIQISRSPFGEYHTDKDTPEIVSEYRILRAVDTTYDIIRKIERDFTPKPTYQGVPCLSAYGLWKPDLSLEKIYLLLPLGLSIAEISERTNISFDFVYSFVKEMKDRRLIE